MDYFKHIFQPELFQGRKKNNNYFEGWYYKQVSADQRYSVAFIPGISLELGKEHAFVQVMFCDNSKASLITDYIRFPLSDFSYNDEPFQVNIAAQSFSKTAISVNLHSSSITIKGQLQISNMKPIRNSVMQPNIMGFFGYFSIMECYHGVISMKHQIDGELNINGQIISFDGGVGYIEKDWGRSFPKHYVWLQSNHFSSKSASAIISVANIPFIGMEFKGFICVVNIDDKEYRFATYNGAKIIKEEIKEKNASFHIKKGNLILDVVAKAEESAVLIAPKDGKMVKAIKEGLSGTLKIKLSETNGKVIFDEIGTNAGVEIVTV